MIVLLDAEDHMLVDRIFTPLDKSPECDGQTDRQISRGYYSGLHCG